MRPAAVPSICKDQSAPPAVSVFITSLPREVIRCQYPQIIIPVINFLRHIFDSYAIPHRIEILRILSSWPVCSFSFLSPTLTAGKSSRQSQFQFNIMIETKFPLNCKPHFARFSEPQMLPRLVPLGTQFLFSAHDILHRISHPRVFLAEMQSI